MSTSAPIKSSEDIQKVREVLKKHRRKGEEVRGINRNGHTRNLALFELGMHLAFRGCDLLSLNLRHVINKNVGDEIVISKEKKTQKRRVTILNQQCIDVLRKLIVQRQAEGAALDDALFVSERALTRLTIVSLSRLWKQWCEAAGLEGNFASHSGRKTKAYIMRTEDGLPIEVLMQVLNHSSPAMTLRYASIQPEEVKQFYMRPL